MAAAANDRKLFTNSRSASYRACPRMHYYAYVQRYRALQENDAQVFGTCIHAMLEAYWLARKAGLDSEQRLYAGLDAMNRRMDPFQQSKAEAMFCAYTSIWDGIDVEVIAVEKTFQFPMLNPETGSKSRTWTMAGKLDLLIRFNGMFHGQDFTGVIAFVEHKTSSEDTSPGSAYRKKLGMDGQCGQYFEGSDALASVFGYKRVDRGIYDVLAKPQIIPRKATPVEDRKYVEARPATPEEPARLYEGQHDHDETPEEFAARLERAGGILTSAGKKLKPFKATPVEKRKYTVAKPAQEAQPRRLHANMRENDETPDEYAQRCADKIAANLEDYFAQIEVTRTPEAREEYLFDVWQQGQLMHESEQKKRAPKNTDACFKYGSQCDFWPVCADGVRLDDPTRYRVKEHDSEELVEAKALPAPVVVPTVTPAIRERMEEFEKADVLAQRKAAVAEVVSHGVEACHGEVVVREKTLAKALEDEVREKDAALARVVDVGRGQEEIRQWLVAAEAANKTGVEQPTFVKPPKPEVACAACGGSSVVLGDGQEEPCPTCRPEDHAARLVEIEAEELASLHVHTNWTGQSHAKCGGHGCPECGGTGDEHGEVPAAQCGDTNCPKRDVNALTYRQRVIETRVGRGLAQQLAVDHTTRPSPPIEARALEKPASYEPPAPGSSPYLQWGKPKAPPAVIEAPPVVIEAPVVIDTPVVVVEAPVVIETPVVVESVEPEFVCGDCGNTIANPDAECPHCANDITSLQQREWFDPPVDPPPVAVPPVRSAAVVFDEDSIPTF